MYQTLEAIRNAVATAGLAAFNSQALYDATESLSVIVDGVERYSFSETKRTSTNVFGIYEAVEVEEDLFRVDAEWFPCKPPQISTGQK